MQTDKDDLAKFKLQLEREIPELAKSLTQEIRTNPKNLARAVEKAFKQPDKRIERNPQDLAAKKEMAKLAAGISKDKSIMERIKGISPELNEWMQHSQKKGSENVVEREE